MLTVSELFIYPVKSLGGIAVSSAMVTAAGFQYDRRWMLVDEHNRFISQREIPLLALLQTFITDDGIKIEHKHSGLVFTIPFQPKNQECINVEIWEDVCTAQLVSDEADNWFSEILSFPCRLVYMPDDAQRKVDQDYAAHNEITAFSDGFPFLLIGQSSLDDLNSRLAEPLPINRFRPNIVFTGGIAFEEDLLERVNISGVHFFIVKPCARCVITTTNQQTAEKGKEPLATLSAYRRKNNNVYFGQNLLHDGKGLISVGDMIEIVKRRTQSFL